MPPPPLPSLYPRSDYRPTMTVGHLEFQTIIGFWARGLIKKIKIIIILYACNIIITMFPGLPLRHYNKIKLYNSPSEPGGRLLLFIYLFFFFWRILLYNIINIVGDRKQDDWIFICNTNIYVTSFSSYYV